MKVGLFINTQFPEGFSVAERVPEMVKQVRAAREPTAQGKDANSRFALAWIEIRAAWWE